MITDFFKDIVYYISLKELEMSVNVFLGEHQLLHQMMLTVLSFVCFVGLF